MGSQSGPGAWGLPAKVNARRRTRREKFIDFDDYIRAMTAPGLGHDRSAPPPSPREREELFLADDREAMHFFSESNMC
jgi:hypothetical protein